MTSTFLKVAVDEFSVNQMIVSALVFFTTLYLFFLALSSFPSLASCL